MEAVLDSESLSELANAVKGPPPSATVSRARNLQLAYAFDAQTHGRASRRSGVASQASSRCHGVRTNQPRWKRVDMIGDRQFDGLVEAPPVNFAQSKVDWSGVAELLQTQNIKPVDVVAVSSCRFSTAKSKHLWIAHPLRSSIRQGSLLRAASERC